MDEHTISTLENLYRITLTERERRLLRTPGNLLNPLESQEKYLLQMALEALRCPGCNGVICQRSAATGTFEPGKSQQDDAYQCPLCQAHLTWHLFITGGQEFTLSPGQTVTIPPGEGSGK